MPGTPRKPKTRCTVRRSFALPARLLDQVLAAAPADGPGNLNALVRSALEEYVARRREEEFAEEMARLAADPAVRRASRDIQRKFRCADRDGL